MAHRAGTRLAIALALALVPARALAAPAVIVDGMTGARFVEQPTLSGTTFRCLGVGGRKIFTFKIYSIAYCLDSASADEIVRDAIASHAGKSGDDLGDALKHDDAFFDALMRAPGEKMLVVRFARDVDHSRLQGAFQKALEKVLPRQDVERVSAILTVDAREGDVAILRTQGDQFVMQLGTTQRVLPSAEAINHQLWRVWLGHDSATPNLKESIATRAASRPALGGSGGSRTPITAPP